MEISLGQTGPLATFRGQDEIRSLSCFLQRQPAPSRLDQAARLQRVAESFEAIFVRQVLREMRNSVLKSSLFGQGLASEIYQEMFDDYLAEAIGKAGGFGLNEMIVQDMQPARPRIGAQEASQLYKNQTLSEMPARTQGEREK